MVMVGVEFLCDLIFPLAFIQPLSIVEKLTEIVVGIGIVRVERNGSPEFFLCS